MCFAREWSPCDIEFVNLLGPRSQSGFKDLLIVTYDLLALRNTPYWSVLRRELIRLCQESRRVVFFPQDDYTMCDELDDLYLIPNATHVFTPITRDLEILYPRSRQRLEFHEALTGYLSEEFVSQIPRDVALKDRSIDVGQRVRRLSPVFGREAQAKAQIATLFGEHAAAHGFRVDISTRPEDVLLGDQWTEFLLNSKFTVGRLGGASVCDPQGRLADRFRRQLARKKGHNEDEIGRMISWRGARFGDFSAISPRIFEAAALGVCQILVEDHYVKGLLPNEHYISLASDLSNIDQVFHTMNDLAQCQEIVHNARDVLVGSGNFTYKRFTENFWRTMGYSGALGQATVVDASYEFLPLFDISVASRDRLKALVVDSFLTKKKTVTTAQIAQELNLSPDLEDSEAADLEGLCRTLNLWLAALRQREIPLESLVIPWEPAVVAASDLSTASGN